MYYFDESVQDEQLLDDELKLVEIRTKQICNTLLSWRRKQGKMVPGLEELLLKYVSGMVRVLITDGAQMMKKRTEMWQQ